jgi:hypothetical protein
MNVKEIKNTRNKEKEIKNKRNQVAEIRGDEEEGTAGIQKFTKKVK